MIGSHGRSQESTMAIILPVELEGEFVFEDNYFSLLPGERRTVHFRPAENAQSTELSVAGYTVKS